MLPEQKVTAVLSVEDDEFFQGELCGELGREFRIHAAHDIESAKELLGQYRFDFVLLDRFLGNSTSISLIPEIRSLNSHCCILLLTSDTDFSSAKEALDLGAVDYVVKPASLIPEKGERRHKFFDHLIHRMKAARTHLSVAVQNAILKSRLEQNTHTELVGRSPSLVHLRSQIKKYKGLSSPILITGESGTGKELVARLLHEQEGEDRPFVEVNCGAIPANLIESHLFGHVKGAFTGAVANAQGYFDKANGGDLFLDEIGDVPYEVQVKLLRVLETGTFNPVGSSQIRRTSFRLICATHVNLEKQVYEQKFRADLFYRINGLPIRIEPLRARSEDIADLAPYFLLKCAGVNFSVHKDAIKFLKKLTWPGNVRELRNAVELGYANARERGRAELRPEDFEISHTPYDNSQAQVKLRLPLSLEEISPEKFSDFISTAERMYISKALELCGFDLALAQVLLGVSRTTLYQKLKEHGISPKAAKVVPSSIKKKAISKSRPKGIGERSGYAQ